MNTDLTMAASPGTVRPDYLVVAGMVEHGARVVQFTLSGMFPKKRNWVLRNTPLAHDWVFGGSKSPHFPHSHKLLVVLSVVKNITQHALSRYNSSRRARRKIKKILHCV